MLDAVMELKGGDQQASSKDTNTLLLLSLVAYTLRKAIVGGYEVRGMEALWKVKLESTIGAVFPLVKDLFLLYVFSGY